MPHTAVFITGPARSGKDTASSFIRRWTFQQQDTDFRSFAFAATLKFVTGDLIELFYGPRLSWYELEERKNANRSVYWSIQPNHASIGAGLIGICCAMTVLAARSLSSGLWIAILQFAIFFSILIIAGPAANVRTLLQKIGSEVMRKRVSDDIWVDALWDDVRGFIVNRHDNESDTDSEGEEKLVHYSRTVTFTDTRFDNEAVKIASRLRREYPDIRIAILRLEKRPTAPQVPLTGWQKWLVDLFGGPFVGSVATNNLNSTQAAHSSEMGLSLDIMSRMPEGAREYKVQNDGSLAKFRENIERMMQSIAGDTVVEAGEFIDDPLIESSKIASDELKAALDDAASEEEFAADCRKHVAEIRSQIREDERAESADDTVD